MTDLSRTLSILADGEELSGFNRARLTGADSIGLYLDPSVRYYFHGNQPKSIRTDKPFMFNLDAGLRFKL